MTVCTIVNTNMAVFNRDLKLAIPFEELPKKHQDDIGNKKRT